MLDLLPMDMADLSSEELILLFYPKEQFEDELIWVVGNYMNYVWEEAVVKGRVLCEASVKGYLRYMYYQSRGMNMPQLGYISQITISQNDVYDNG